MKVGTDGILLEVQTPVTDVKRILDIDAGSGLLALMLAQCTDENVIINAVELDVDAAQQAQKNIVQSPWVHRMGIHTEDTQQWIPHQTVRFDSIINNPPYYEQDVGYATPQRGQVRYTTTLDHQVSLTLAMSNITEEGPFHIILSEQIGSAFTQQALNMGWHLRLRTDVTGTEARLSYRVSLVFSPQAGGCFGDRLMIRGPDQHYSGGHTALIQTFYLLM